MKRLLIVAMLLAGCNPPVEEQVRVDQCMRREIFQQCMKALPAGPVSTKYNDWDEVVERCGEIAFYQSRRVSKYIKPECAA